jgi:hypothetical protein
MSKEKYQSHKVINNKTFHLTIPGSVHKKLRAFLFLKEISMQEFFRMISEKVVLEDTYISNLIDQRVDDIKNKKLDKLRNIEEKDLYNVIEQNSPFKK